jgi:hypothetical protein
MTKKLKQPLILISSDEEDINGSHLIEEVKKAAHIIYVLNVLIIENVFRLNMIMLLKLITYLVMMIPVI